jgi:hypothetical protein
MTPNSFSIPKGGGKTEHYGKVHASNVLGKFCYESPAYKKHIDKKRKTLQNAAAKSRELVKVCQITRINPLSSYFPSQSNYAPTSPLPRVDNAFEDDALLTINEELDSAIHDSNEDMVGTTSTSATHRDRVKHLKKCLEAQLDNNSKRYLLACAYAKFEECIRHGKTELQAGRFVAENLFTDERDNRINGRKSGHQWYRYRPRSLIVVYRHFIATGTLMPESRGKCGEKSLIHDPGVQNLCRETIGQINI